MSDKLDENALNAAGWTFIENWPKFIGEDMNSLLFNTIKSMLRVAIEKYASYAASEQPPPLKPCPFCGKQPKVETWLELDRSWPEPNDTKHMDIRCCESFDTAEAWNHRVNGE